MIASFFFGEIEMNNEFYDWFNEQSKHISDTDEKLFMMWSSSAWNKQQEIIDEQHEMLVNQAKTIFEYQKKIKEFKEFFEEAIYGNDGDVQSYYRKRLEDVENE